MNDAEGNLDQDGTSGFFQSVKAVLAALGPILHTRLELFVTELEEERERIKRTLILSVLIVCGILFGFALLTIFLVAVFWQQGWIPAIGGLALLYFTVAVVAGLKLRGSVLRRPGLFPASLAELGKDCEELRSSAR